MKFSRVILIVLDGLGVGSAPDAALFGDTGSDTLRSIAQSGLLNCREFSKLGLGNLYQEGLPGIALCDRPSGLCVRLTEVSAGKDSTTGHWEMMGILRNAPSPTFPGGFPESLIEQFTQATGRGVLGNKVASGTAIIDELAPEQLRTGKWIVYTSADSVFQIAAHKGLIPLSELYEACETARRLLRGPELGVDRVIARPFEGTSESGFVRTGDRRDFSLAPPTPTVLDCLKTAGKDVIAVGKISDLFAGKGISASYPDYGTKAQLDRVAQLQQERTWEGLLFVNLSDFDTKFGHRNDVAGFARELNAFDSWLAGLIPVLSSDEVLLLTGDHGNDPATPSTDHSREQVPFIAYNRDFGTCRLHLAPRLPGLHHVGVTVASALGVDCQMEGLDLLAGLALVETLE